MSAASRHQSPRGARLAIAVMALACALAALSADARNAPAQSAPRPNVVVIQTDDQTLSSVFATFVTQAGTRARVMPRTLDLLRGGGISFTRYYATYPLCCPSRATLLTGRYPHSHGVLGNLPPRGGYPRYPKDHNLAVWLQDAGYRTIHLGKFLNGYGETGQSSPSEVPPGWDYWATFPGLEATIRYYGYEINVNGSVEGPYGNPNYDQTTGKDDPGCPETPPLLFGCAYQSDTLTALAVSQIESSAPGRPFFLSLDYVAPHGDRHPPIGPEPATRHYNTAINTPAPRPPSFNEFNLDDKPSFIRSDADPLGPGEVRRIRIEYQKSLESLRSVDYGVGKLVDALRRVGELGNTYVFFVSDNGFFQGEHRLERSKFLPYEPAVHMPLLIRGPGIKPGSRSGELVANTDVAPTILALARTSADRTMDGRSLIRFWTDTSKRTLRPILIESFARATDIDDQAPRPRRKHNPGASTSITAPIENYLAVRFGSYKYVEYDTGDRELYDLVKDPYELVSLHRDPRYYRIKARLRDLLILLEGCHAAECRAESKPLPEPR